jgi:hypothetical protein
MVKGDLDAETKQNYLCRLKVFAGVGEFPARVKCASLSWHTLRAAIEGRDESVTTEDEHRQDLQDLQSLCRFTLTHGFSSVALPFTIRRSAFTAPLSVAFPFKVTAPLGAMTFAGSDTSPLSVRPPEAIFNVSHSAG